MWNDAGAPPAGPCVLVIFGAKRLPEVGRSLGSGMREFMDGITKGDEDPAERTITSGEETETK